MPMNERNPMLRGLMKLLLCLMLATTIGVGCKKEVAPRSLPTLTEEERRQKFEDDLTLIKRYDDGLRQTLEYARNRPDLFVKSEDVQLKPKQKRELRRIWSTVLDYMRALDGIKEYWKDFHKFGAIRDRRAHTESFMVGYVAWLTQYQHGLQFIDLTVPSKVMEKVLDERSRKFDIPQGSFAALKWNIIHVKAVTRLLGSRQYWKTVAPSMTDYDCHKKAWCNWALGSVDQYHDASKDALAQRAAVDFSYNAFDIARDMSFDAWFPVQKGVASWMGDTKVRRLHQHLVSKEQLAEMRTKMKPGDVVVARHNWYLSNVGLPGFWPHAELYVGAPDELSAYFDDDQVKLWVQNEHGHESFADYLKSAYPDAWKAYSSSDEHGPMRIVEAVSEGVVFNSLEKAAGADYVGVLRPRRDKVAKARAVARGFELYGLPYDFNFDFTTDDTLVCTELVYKSWRAGHPDSFGVAPARMMGRMTLPANDIVRHFDETCDDPDGPLEFVYFIDGREKKNMAVIGSREAFRKTWERPKWDTMQE